MLRSCPTWIDILTERSLAEMYRRTANDFQSTATPRFTRRDRMITGRLPSRRGQSVSSSESDSAEDEALINFTTRKLPPKRGHSVSNSESDSADDEAHQAVLASAPPLNLAAQTVIDLENPVLIFVHLLEGTTSVVRSAEVHADLNSLIFLWAVRNELEALGVTPGSRILVRRAGRWIQASWHFGYYIRLHGFLVLKTPGADTGDWQIDG